MANIKKNKEIFPEGVYDGTNISYVTAGNNILGSIQIKHPSDGMFELAVSNDYDTKDFGDKLWTPLPVRLLGENTYIPFITFTDEEPTVIKLGCFSFAFLRATLTGSGGIYRAIYNVPEGS